MQPIVKEGTPRPGAAQPRIGAMKTSVVVAVAACAIGMAARLRTPPMQQRRRRAPRREPAGVRTTIEEIEVRRAGEPNVKRHRHRRRPRPHRGAARARPAAEGDRRAEGRRSRLRDPARRRRPPDRPTMPARRAARPASASGTSAGSDAAPDGGLHRGLVRRSGRARRQRRPRRVAARSTPCDGGIENTNYFADTARGPLRPHASSSACAPTSCRSTCS